MNNFPDFSAYEINELAKRALRSEYYAKCLRFVKQYLDLTEENVQLLTDKQRGWLWGIKADLKENER
jgi:hypothetical protein